MENVLCGKHKQASCQDSATKKIVIKQKWILLYRRHLAALVLQVADSMPS